MKENNSGIMQLVKRPYGREYQQGKSNQALHK